MLIREIPIENVNINILETYTYGYYSNFGLTDIYMFGIIEKLR